MIKGRDNAAESLAHVLELVRTRRQSGLLSVGHMQENRFEEGEIYFQAGQTTYARTGQLLGQEALLRMLSWRQVYFTFLADQTHVNIPSVNSNGSTPGLEWIVPRKLGKDRDVLSLPLTRPQRSIYMLVDGHRTIADLSRCIRKSIPEVERLLSELQERGLVSI
jgi:Domain of unknown function (DUF4388)